ncbi:IclR family transcriptional regulator [Allorhizobium borbori]|uniref:DNA-binding IclR family transcriptional regulator n=1 Tax=Allorhizobium borbori TaxID=485907 RepID=A0A7W6K4H4_9HYPH|nr:IclR family transcriptional regulator [Allorhizobium borbori]MBB4104980.1 DNA-binding IclR family transcriptional regulator [Allorhizobium borbori]PZU24677.1 MAG: IclR family transcriptional regulator [Shinella sp.]
MTMTDDNTDAGRASGIQVIARAASILRCLKTDGKPPSLAQIAAQVDLPRSTVQRIVNALIDEDFVVPASADGGYRLGPSLQALAQAGRVDVATTARSHVVALSQATGETVDLSMMRGNQVLFIDQITGTHRLRTVSAVGEIFPLTNTANGKACLSMLDPETALALIEHEVANLGETAPRSVADIVADVEAARRTGISHNHGEHTPGICAVGTGFRDAAGNIYAISVPVPSPRFPLVMDLIIEKMVEARRAIVRALGTEDREVA